jgi:hypothetical protein
MRIATNIRLFVPEVYKMLLNARALAERTECEDSNGRTYHQNHGNGRAVSDP